VIVCALLLGYRSAETDWRGLTWDRLVALWPSPSPRTEPAAKPQAENGSSSALALTSKATEAASAEAVDAARPETTEPTADPNVVEAPKDSASLDKAQATFLDEIRRESERTKERNAELERVKEEESKKLAESEDERRRAAEQQNRFRLRQRQQAQAGAGAVNRQFAARERQFQREIEAMQQRFQREFAEMEAMQRRMMAEMTPADRERLRQWGIGNPNNVPRPGRNPGVPGPRMFMGIPQGNRNDPDNITEYQEFRGPGGSHGFIIRQQRRIGPGPRPDLGPDPRFQIDPKPDEVPDPPPPPAIQGGR
jgi:hypothetical protein